MQFMEKTKQLIIYQATCSKVYYCNNIISVPNAIFLKKKNKKKICIYVIMPLWLLALNNELAYYKTSVGKVPWVS